MVLIFDKNQYKTFFAKRALLFLQLSRMRQKNSAFHEYTEGAIRFLPTYKYDPGTDSWDSRSIELGFMIQKLLFLSFVTMPM